MLTHFICTGWIKNTMTSMLAFNIAQFFPFLNYQLLPLILDKAEFNSKVSFFFHDYLVGRKTKYIWNNFSFLLFNVDIGVGQRSALSPILSALYLAPILHILEKQLKKQFQILFFFCNYYIISFLLEQFRLIIKHGKIEVFHFSRLHRVFKPLPLDLMSLGGLIF